MKRFKIKPLLLAYPCGCYLEYDELTIDLILCELHYSRAYQHTDMEGRINHINISKINKI